jgi:hypothetical protein
MFNNISLRLINRSLIKTNLQLAIDRNIFADRLLEEMQISETKSVENTDGFLKFVSQSRDWAFQYIEDVQKAISQFVNEVEPEINYFKEYGDIGAMAPNYYSMKKFVEEYEKLKMLLPTEEENK